MHWTLRTADDAAGSCRAGQGGAFGLPYAAVFGELDGEAVIQKAAVCPGAGGSTMGEALAAGAQVYITGDISHHEGIDAVAQGMAVIDAGHYGIEHILQNLWRNI